MIFKEEEPLVCPLLSARTPDDYARCIGSECALWERQGTWKGFCGLTDGLSTEPVILDVIREDDV